MSDEQAAFIARYHEVVDELDRTGRNDPETMWLLGSLVARLVTNTDAQNWTQLKLMLDNKSLTELVETLDTNAATYEAEGKTKAAYVARQRDIGGAYRRVIGRHFPAMTLIVAADLLEPGAKVEIEATAVIPNG